MKKPKASKAVAAARIDVGVDVGVAWWREADWPRVKALLPDADALHDTYAEWLDSAEASVKALTRRGVAVRPVVIDLGALIVWGLARGRKLDGAARAQYVSERLRAEHQAASRRPE